MERKTSAFHAPQIESFEEATRRIEPKQSEVTAAKWKAEAALGWSAEHMARTLACLWAA